MPMTATNPPRVASPTRTASHSRPGKFQGEPEYVASFWRAALEGQADYDLYDGDTLISAFLVSYDDVEAWPELADVHALAVWERDDGFVCSMRFDREGFETWRAACELEPGEGDEYDDE